MLDLQNISYSVQGADILHAISASFLPGELSVIIGPNGSGKSTLLRVASGEYWPTPGGQVYYGDARLEKKKIHEYARFRGVLTQHSELNFPLNVREVVMMGRYPHFSVKPSARDEEIVDQVLDKFKLTGFSERNYLTLSGGEQQRVHFARVLAQLWPDGKDDIKYLLLDEPVSFLDLNYQHEFLKTSKEMAIKGHVTVAVLHDINLACRYADKIFVLNHGRLIAAGSPADIITPELIFELYGVRCTVQLSGNNIPYILIEG